MTPDSNILEQIGITIRKLRKAKNLTQAELSSVCGVDRKFLSSLERGQRNVSLLTLCQITHALGKDFLSFVSELRTTTPQTK